MKLWSRLLAGYRSWGLVKRSSLLSVALLLCIQLAAQVVIRSSIEDSVQADLRTGLESSVHVWTRLLDQNAQRLQLGASILAADFGFRSAVNSRDAETIESALENSSGRIGATVAGLLDTDFSIKALTGAKDNVELVHTLEGISRAMAQESQKSRSILVNDRLHQFVLTPVRAPAIVGWIIMGFPVDQQLASDMESLTSTQVLIYQARKEGAPRVIHSTRAVQGPLDPNLFGQTQGSVTLGDEDFAFRHTGDKSISDGVEVVLLASAAKAREVFGYTKLALVVIDGLGLLLFAIGVMELARRVSKPLGLLVADANRLGQGDYSQKIEDFGRADEVGDFARAFDLMRRNIQASQAEVRQLAYWDRLTGLPNRAQFIERLKAVVEEASAPGHKLAVIVMDLDRFKHINDVLGYDFGDKVLQIIGERLAGVFADASHLVCRMGGGQFAVLLPQADLEMALRQAQVINAMLENPVTFGGQTVDLRAGMGISLWPEHAGDADVLIGHAEVAMYAAKRRSAGLQVYDAALDSGSALTLSMLSDLRRAIDHNELRLFLQPKIDLANDRVIAAEALVRWQHPTRGMVPPMEFIPFAEQTGFVRHLTLWMLEQAARIWRELQPENGHIRIAINLSTRDLMDNSFADKLERVLGRYDAPRDGFCLEITESAIMDDPERAEQTLNELSAKGYKLSIDDFGTGYSSLAYLKRLPVDELKIDKSFVMGMEKSTSDAQIVKSTIDLAHNLGLSVVAEGIENRSVYALLGKLQCDEGQGYYMSRPIPSSEFSAWRLQWEAKQGVAT